MNQIFAGKPLGSYMVGPSHLLKILALWLVFQECGGSNFLLITMGGTRSHKIPFAALAQGLASRGHHITLVSAFPEGDPDPQFLEITPYKLVSYVRNFTDWDLIGARIRGENPVPLLDTMKYGYEACEEFLTDRDTKRLLRLRNSYHMMIIDGAYPECALGLAYHFNTPFIYLNTVGFYTQSISLSGTPTPYSVTPFFAAPFSDNMGIVDRATNAFLHLACAVLHSITIRLFLNPILRKHIQADMPSAYEISKNVSFILQNGHFSVTYPRPYLPNVAEIACIHCRAANQLPKDLENFIQKGGDRGFIYVSMGSSVQAANTPVHLREMFLSVFSKLQYQVLWKWEDSNLTAADHLDLPHNVMKRRWLPQQDLLGHEKIRGFVTHGGLLSLFETVFHGVPVVVMPVFCDHDANAEKAVRDGYAFRLELKSLTQEKLLYAINQISTNSRFKIQAEKRSLLLRDQSESPLNRAIFWTEYVLRHNGASHLQSPARHMTAVRYYSIDLITFCIIFMYLLCFVLKSQSVSFKKHSKLIQKVKRC